MSVAVEMAEPDAPQRDTSRSRRNIVLALVHVALAGLILAGFVFVQMQNGG